MIINIVLLIVGLIALLKGADYMVDGASYLALKNNVSKLAVGLTVVAFGTSAPELVVNTVAACDQHFDIVFGNVLGSNNFNLLVILGIVGLMSPIVVKSETTWREIPFSAVVAVILLALANDALLFGQEVSVIGRIEGALLLSLFAAFIYYVFKQMKASPDELEADLEQKELSKLQTSLYILGGMAGLAIGGHLVVTNAVSIAQNIGVSEKIIGLTIIAFGTSLPELTTSVVAVRKQSSDLAVGNIIGSNIFNILLIVGCSALVHPIDYNISFNVDFYLLIGATLFLFVAMFTGKKRTLDRWEAALLLLAYLIYMAYMILQEI